MFEPLEDLRFGVADAPFLACAGLPLLLDEPPTEFLVSRFFPSLALPEAGFLITPLFPLLRFDDGVLGVRPVFAFPAGLRELTDFEVVFVVVFFEVAFRLSVVSFLGGVSEDRLLRPLVGCSLRLVLRAFFGGSVSL